MNLNIKLLKKKKINSEQIKMLKNDLCPAVFRAIRDPIQSKSPANVSDS